MVEHTGTFPSSGRWMSEDCRPGLVSVIVPTYNRASFLLQAMDSVRAQTYRPVELVVVDDGSTDGTPEAVSAWASACAPDGAFELRYLSQRNQGAPVARNRGLQECRGEYVMFLDSDDMIGPTKLAASVARLAGAGPMAIAHGPWRCLYSGPAGGYGPVHGSDALGPEAERLRAHIGGGSGMPPCVYLLAAHGRPRHRPVGRDAAPAAGHRLPGPRRAGGLPLRRRAREHHLLPPPPPAARRPPGQLPPPLSLAARPGGQVARLPAGRHAAAPRATPRCARACVQLLTGGPHRPIRAGRRPLPPTAAELVRRGGQRRVARGPACWPGARCC